MDFLSNIQCWNSAAEVGNFHVIFSSQKQVVIVIKQIASQLNKFFKENKRRIF